MSSQMKVQIFLVTTNFTAKRTAVPHAVGNFELHMFQKRRLVGKLGIAAVALELGRSYVVLQVQFQRHLRLESLTAFVAAHRCALPVTFEVGFQMDDLVETLLADHTRVNRPSMSVFVLHKICLLEKFLRTVRATESGLFCKVKFLVFFQSGFVEKIAVADATEEVFFLLAFLRLRRINLVWTASVGGVLFVRLKDVVSFEVPKQVRLTNKSSGTP